VASLEVSITRDVEAGKRLLDSFVYGLAIQENALPFTGPDEVAELVESVLNDDDYPHLAAMAAEHVLRPGYDFGNEFEYGLSLVLDSLEGAFAGVK
jgi:hypothetical protein